MKKLQLLVATCFIAFNAAAQVPDYGLTQLSQLSYNHELSNCWGYVAPNGVEYALVGTQHQLSIVSLADPANPIKVDSVPGPTTVWREVKVWGHYAYVGMDNVGTGLQIVDLTNLPVSHVTSHYFTPTIGITSLVSVHDVQIDSLGYLYLSGTNIAHGAVLIFDLNTDPLNPTYLGVAGNQYSHDNYVRHDTLWSADMLNGYFSVWDISDKTNPVSLATQNTPNNFTHNVWLTHDSHYLLTTDEEPNAYVAAYDVSDINNIRLVNQWRSKNNEAQGAIPHNVHILNDYAYVSYYADGLKVLDAHRPTNLIEVASFDTYLSPSATGFNGAWGVFPYFPSGTVIVSDINTGLHVFQPNLQRACYLEGLVTDSLTHIPLSGVAVKILSTPEYDYSQLTGEYATGYGIAGTYQVVYSVAGYYPDTITVNLQHGIVNIKNVALRSLDTYSYTGQVYQLGTNTPISNAKVLMKSTNFTYNTTTDANGNFTFSQIYADTYDIRVGKWGWHSNEALAQTITDGTSSITIGLEVGHFDDFSMDLGWTVNTTVTTGAWERAIPIGVPDGGGAFFAPNEDASQYISTPNIGTECYVTGNGGNLFGINDNDVDNGTTTLISPKFPWLSQYNYLRFNYWYRTNADPSLFTDSLVIDIYKNDVIMSSEVIATSATQETAWLEYTAFLGFQANTSDSLQIKFRITDDAPDNALESAIDNFLPIAGGTTTSINRLVVFEASPNPFEAYTTIQYDLGQTQETDLIVTDLLGHVVDAQHLSQSQGTIRVGENLPKGIYLVKIGETVKKIVKM